MYHGRCTPYTDERDERLTTKGIRVAITARADASKIRSSAANMPRFCSSNPVVSLPWISFY